MIHVKSFIDRGHSQAKQRTEDVLIDHLRKDCFRNVGSDGRRLFPNNPDCVKYPAAATSFDIAILYITGIWGQIQLDASYPITLKNIDAYRKAARCLWITDNISFKNYTTYPKWIKATDFIWGCERAPEHKGALTPAGRVDDRFFYETGRTSRIPKTTALMIGTDGMNHDLLPVVFDEMDLIFVLGRTDFSDIPNHFLYQEYQHKIICHHYHQNDWYLMRELLNSVEYTINLVEIGYENLTIEGAFCGAQPIYPGNEHFKIDVFGNVEDAGILYFDPSAPGESLKDLLKQRSTWGPKNREALRQHHGASLTVPRMWSELFAKWNSTDYQELTESSPGKTAADTSA